MEEATEANPFSRGDPHSLFGIPRKLDISALFPGENDDPEIPETKERRLLELQLLHNYMNEVAQPFAVPQSAFVTGAWLQDVPRLAMKHENLLYAMLAVSATNLLRSNPLDERILAARDTYQILALGAQRRALQSLNDDGVDATCFASLSILINAFAVLHERRHDMEEIYSPPVQWLKLGEGAVAVIYYLRENTKNAGRSRITNVIESPPQVWADQTLFDEPNRRSFKGVLSQIIPSEELWDEETSSTYEKTLSYIGAIQKGIQNGEPPFALCKRVICFPMFIPPTFISFVEEKRPRALVVLAHFFAVVAQIKAIWWMGNAGEQEIRAIHEALPPEWHGQMIWPIQIAQAAEQLSSQ